jgi:type IV secretion system protein VirB8
MFSKKHSIKSKQAKINVTHSWYKDRYNIVLVQRNLLSLMVFVCIITIGAGLLFVNQISQNKSIEPFVVEIEEKTGIPTVIDQLSLKKYLADEVIQEYFIYSYLRAREGYDYRTYQYDYHKVVRLLSAPSIYNEFRILVSSRNENSPVNLYGRKTRLETKVKSIQDIEGAKQIRLLVKHLNGNYLVKEEHKIIYLKYEFADLNITLEDRLINPLGFRVLEYRVDKDFVAEK